MNLSESFRYVLKHKGQYIFSQFLRADLRTLFQEVRGDLLTLKDVRGEVNHTIKELPERARTGYLLFREELLKELEARPDPREKTLFCIKVLGALTSFVVGSVYGLRKARGEMALGQLITAEVMIKMSRLFVLRFLGEVEKEVGDPEELKKLHFFRDLLVDPSLQEGAHVEPEVNDRAREIVDSLKNYIMAGRKPDLV